MRDQDIERLLSLFTSRDRAEAIVGDLAEVRAQRGSVWFWLQVAGVTIALCGKAAKQAPLRVLGFVTAPAVGAFVIAMLFPQVTDAFLSPAWKDSSPHATRMVTVDDQVQLEVLDWGGSGTGPALVLLAGLGDTAHVFDDFAPTLATHYRVVGVTRRAHGLSSAPATGYAFPRLAEDVVRVIDTLRLDKPVIAGHSIAGEELHVIGARYATKIAGLVYLDAAFDRGASAVDYDAVARTLPPAPRPAPEDQASFTALRAFLERTQGFAGPEAHLRARYLTNADGTVGRMWAPAPPIFQEISREMKTAFTAYNPERIHVPALALYAAPHNADDLMRPWYNRDDATVRDGVQALYTVTRDRLARHQKWFEAFDDRGRVTEIPGAHHLFLSHPREVRQQIEAFMASLSSLGKP